MLLNDNNYCHHSNILGNIQQSRNRLVIGLVWLWLKVTDNSFSVMLGNRQRFLVSLSVL